jgi:predicted nucleotidyltransferase
MEILLIFATENQQCEVIMSDEKRAKIINMIRDTIREAEPTAQIILYGSRARGDAREDSDWDVLAIVDKPRLTLKERSNIQYPIWDKGLDVGEEINVFSYTRRQWEQAPPSLFKYNVMKEGIAL